MPTPQQISADINQMNIRINELQENHNSLSSRMQTAPLFVKSGIRRTLSAIEGEIASITAERDSLLGSLRQEVATEYPEPGINEPSQLQQLKAKYPNAPDHLDVAGLNHLEYMFSDPVGFFRDVAITYTDQMNTKGQAAAQEYANAIREITLSSIPADHYFPMFEALDLNHVNFAVWHIYPEHLLYNHARWIFGRDARPEDLFQTWIDEIKALKAADDTEGYTALKNNVLSILKDLSDLDPAYKEPLSKVPQKTQAEFIQFFMPEVMDAIDQANIEGLGTDMNAKTIMILAAVGIGGVLLISLIGGKKKNGKIAMPTIIKT